MNLILLPTFFIAEYIDDYSLISCKPYAVRSVFEIYSFGPPLKVVVIQTL